MFRSLIIRLSRSNKLRRLVTHWPIAWRMAGRFVAGEKIEQAVQVIRQLNANGIYATLDHLGEHTDSQAGARNACAEIIEALDIIEGTGIQSNVSIKLTQLGLTIDKGLCAENLHQILERAQETSNFIRIDMEDSQVTQLTLDLLLKVHREGFRNVGIVIQAYLYRSQKDIEDLIEASIPVRLCKGAYREPPEIAYPGKSDVDIAYDKLSVMLIKASQQNGQRGARNQQKIPPLAALATHDENRINYAAKCVEDCEVDKRDLEYQMLHGSRRDLQVKLVESGYPVRVYVPYGTEWYPYFMRRLAERPANLWFFISNLLRR